MAGVKPQFEVVLPHSGSGFGTEVWFNGVRIANVVAVHVENDARLDDLVTSRITIDLSEPTTVSRGGE